MDIENQRKICKKVAEIFRQDNVTPYYALNITTSLFMSTCVSLGITLNDAKEILVRAYEQAPEVMKND